MNLQNPAKFESFVTQEKPLTLLSLENLIQSDLFIKVQILQAVIGNGIMDFLVEQREDQS